MMKRTRKLNKPSRLLATLLVVSVQAVLGTESHAAGPSLSGFGKATVDGVLGSVEWAGAARIPILVNLPEGGTASGDLLAMNDTENLYLAIRFSRTAADAGNSVAFEFDNNRNGVWLENGDDALVINPDLGLTDNFRTNKPPCPPGSPPGACGLRDVDDGGSNDGAGAFLNDGNFTIYEFSHPLNSGDSGHDFALNLGDAIGFQASIRLINGGVIADTNIPAGGLGEIVIASPPVATAIPTLSEWSMVLLAGLLGLLGAGMLGRARNERRR